VTQTVDVPSCQAEVVADVDVCVAGGGPAGLGAALAAARSGARVCLLERYGFLGGNFTVASVGTICGLYVSDAGGWAYVTRGIAEEVAEALKSSGSANGPIAFKGTAVLLYVPWAAKRLFDHLIGELENITLFLHALVSDVVVDGDRGVLYYFTSPWAEASASGRASGHPFPDRLTTVHAAELVVIDGRLVGRRGGDLAPLSGNAV